MIKYVNECCGCAVPAYPCLGSSCPNRNVPHYVCDNCGVDDEDEDIYEFDGQQLCAECILNSLEKLNLR